MALRVFQEGQNLMLKERVEAKHFGQAQATAAIKLGEFRPFGGDGFGGAELRADWAPPEDGHNWNDGEEPTLLLTIAPLPRAACLLRVIGQPFIAQRVREQRVTLFVNGLRLGAWRLTSSGACTLQAEIEPEHWLVRDTLGIARCVWHLPDSVSPSRISTVRDERRLGFCFQSIAILPP